MAPVVDTVLNGVVVGMAYLTNGTLKNAAIDALIGETLKGQHLSHSGLITLGKRRRHIVVIPCDGGTKAHPMSIDMRCAVLRHHDYIIDTQLAQGLLGHRSQ